MVIILDGEVVDISTLTKAAADKSKDIILTRISGNIFYYHTTKHILIDA